MPDNMTPEQGISADFLRSIGSQANLPANEVSEQSAQNFPQPESRTNPLDIRMSNQPPDQLTAEQEFYLSNMGRERMMLPREKLSGGYEYSTFADSLVELGDIVKRRIDFENRKAKGETSVEVGGQTQPIDKVIKEIISHEERERESARRAFKISVGAGQDNLESVIMMLGHLKEPAPFNANMEERHFEGGDKSLKAIARYFDGELPKEIIGLYHRYDEINSQQYGLFNLLLAAGGSVQGYYDAVKQAGETLIDRGRHHASSADMRAAFAKRDPGITDFLADETHSEIKDSLVTKESREEQIRCMDDARYFINLDTDVAQFDIEQPMGKEGILTPEANIDQNVSKTQLEKARLLAKLVFGGRDQNNNLVGVITERDNNGNVIRNSDGTIKCVEAMIDKNGKIIDLNGNEITLGLNKIFSPQEVLTWFADGDGLGGREEWMSKMLALLEYRDPDSNMTPREILKNSSFDINKINDLANSVIKRAMQIKEGLNSKTDISTFNRAASLIAVTSWIEMDKAWQTAGRLAWKWEYKEVNGRMRRLFESGGIYKAYDSINLMYFWRRWITYKAGWKSNSQFFMPASDDFRREAYKHRPDWMPPISWLSKDRRMKNIYDILFRDDRTAVMFRARRIAGTDGIRNRKEDELQVMINDQTIRPNLEQDISVYLQKNAWVFETAYKNKEGKNIGLPMFMPKNLENINVWKYIVLDKKTGLTVWDELCSGKDMSDIDFSKINFEALDRMWVSMSMLTRFARLWIDPYEAEKDPSIQGFFGDASTQSIAELSKRIFLAFRDLPNEENYKRQILTILPFAIAQYTAKATGLLDSSFGTSEERKKIAGRWNVLMSKWMRAIKWMPSVILDSESLYDSKDHPNAKAEIKSMTNDMVLILEMYKLAFERLSMSVYSADKHALENVYNDQITVHSDKALLGALDWEAEEANMNAGLVTVNLTGNSEQDVFKEFFGERR